MKKILCIGLIVASPSVLADCYIRSSINLGKQNIQAKDIQKIVTPDAQGSKCVARYRVNIDGDWQTAEGVGVAKTESQACLKALDVSRGAILEEVSPSRMQSDSQMICSDLPEIRVHRVRVGDIIWESETDVHSIIDERKYFWYKRSRCRMFVERDTRNQNLWLYQGVICAVDSGSNSKWQVIDKY